LRRYDGRDGPAPQQSANDSRKRPELAFAPRSAHRKEQSRQLEQLEYHDFKSVAMA
jgi:hypothetical protein